MRGRVVLWVVFALFVLASCGLDTSGLGPIEPRLWMDGPLENVANVGDAIALTLHADQDVGPITFYYKFGSNPMTALDTFPLIQINSEIYEATMTWIPTEPGRYHFWGNAVSYYAQNAQYVDVLARSESEMIYETPTAGPTTPGITLVPVGEVNIWADTILLKSGNCTYIRWNSVFVDQTFVNGESVALMGSKQVCPAMNTTYSLIGNYAGGSVEKSVTISVQPIPATPTHTPSPDNLGPELTNISESVNQVYDGTQCGVTANTISVRVTDPSGIGNVTLWYRAKKSTPAQTGAWRSITMTGAGGGNYQGTLGIAELTSSLGLYADGIVEYYIIATDSKGNSTQSPTSIFDTVMCFG